MSSADDVGPPVLTDPPPGVAEPLTVLCDALVWVRARVPEKLDGLDDAALRREPTPLTWSPLGLVRHLTHVERRWMRWGFLGEPAATAQPYPPDGDEWDVRGRDTGALLEDYRAEATHSDRCARVHDVHSPSRLGGRFGTRAEAPVLGRILVHLHQEYARHLGQLDVARELIDGAVGE